MTFPFVLVAPDGTALRRCAAESLSDARAILRPTPTQAVVSQASLDAAPVRVVVAPPPPDPPRARCQTCRVNPAAVPARLCTDCGDAARARRKALNAAAQVRHWAQLDPDARADKVARTRAGRLARRSA